jgi:hypothetical protein
VAKPAPQNKMKAREAWRNKFFMMYGFLWAVLLLRDGRLALAVAAHFFRPYYITRSRSGKRIIQDSDFCASPGRAL